MKISLCITVFNEEKHIERLLGSIAKQSRQPDEVIIVDGGSTDATKLRIKNYELRIKNLTVLTKKGNRAIGRNEAIKIATGDIIAITDAGCELDEHWLAEITKAFIDPKISVVSGYYKGRPANILQKSLVPYVLVMPDKVNPQNFLPSTRSMAMRKAVWERLGGFPSEYTWNEDYVFSKRIEKAKIPLSFAQQAIVYWFPRETIGEGFAMFYAFARGDAQAHIWRPKVLLLLLRFTLAGLLIIAALYTQKVILWQLLGLSAVLYVVWAILKNYRYVQKPLAFFYLPLWQIVSDSAVFIGSIIGFLQRR